MIVCEARTPDAKIAIFHSKDINHYFIISSPVCIKILDIIHASRVSVRLAIIKVAGTGIRVSSGVAKAIITWTSQAKMRTWVGQIVEQG